MNPIARPDRPAPAAGAGSLLPDFAAPATAAEFPCCFEEIASPQSRQEPPGEQPGKQDDQREEAGEWMPPLALFWPPGPINNQELAPIASVPPSSQQGFKPDSLESANGTCPVPEEGKSGSPNADAPAEQPKAALSLAGFTPLSPDESQEPPLLRLPVSKPAETGQKLSGMAAAQQELMLSRSHKANEIAARPEQNLPGARFFALDVEFSAAPLQPVPFRVPERQETPVNPLFPVNPGQAHLPPALGGMELVLEPAALAEPDFSLVDLIHQHVQFLRAGSDDSLEVSLTPDPETELFVRIERIDGELFVRVRLDRGNLAELEFQWPQMQQALAAQGIKLDALNNPSFDASAHQHNTPHRPEQDPERQSIHSSSSRNFSLPPAHNPESSENTNSSTRWQRWA